MKTPIETDQAPQAIGTYSQSIKVGNQLFISGQIPLEPKSMSIIEGSFEQQVEQVCKNLQAVATAAGATLDHVVKISVFMIDLSHFETVNQVMARFFKKPYPARAAVQVAGLPKGSEVEMDAILYLDKDLN